MTDIDNKIDYTKYGADAKTMQEISGNLDSSYDLLKAKRNANEEAMTYRKRTNKLASLLEIGDAETIDRVERDFSSGAVKYNQLDKAEKKVANFLIKSGKVDSKTLGLTDSELNKILGTTEQVKENEAKEKQVKEAPKMENKTKDTTAPLPKESVNPSTKDAVETKIANDSQKELEELRAKLAKAERRNALRDLGIQKDYLDDASKIYADPEYPEKATPEDKAKLLDEHIEKTKLRNPNWFGSVEETETKISTHNGKMTSPPKPKTTAVEAAKGKGSSEVLHVAMAEAFRKRT